MSTENTDSKAAKTGPGLKSGGRRAAASKPKGSRAVAAAGAKPDPRGSQSVTRAGTELPGELAGRAPVLMDPPLMQPAASAAPPVSALGRQETLDLLRRNLKVLLFHLASHSESPGRELEALLQEVIFELYTEAQEALALKKSHLKLVKS